MARQASIIKLKGTIGDITFYKTKEGYLARQKGGIDKERFLNDPKFQRTRENAAEFGRAGETAKAFTSALRSVINKTSDNKMNARLVREMMKVIKSDTTNNRGERKPMDGDLTLLKGFEFNQNAPLGSTVYSQPNLEISRDDEQTVAEYFNIVPTDHIVAPAGTTHFRMVNAALIIDFDSGYTFLDVVSSSENPYNGTLISSIQLITDLPADVTQPIFSLVGIEFLQQVNGSFYSLNNGAHNALKIVQIDVLP